VNGVCCFVDTHFAAEILDDLFVWLIYLDVSLRKAMTLPIKMIEGNVLEYAVIVSVY
jgi:hypothetical protein